MKSHYASEHICAFKLPGIRYRLGKIVPSSLTPIQEIPSLQASLACLRPLTAQKRRKNTKIPNFWVKIAFSTRLRSIQGAQCVVCSECIFGRSKFITSFPTIILKFSYLSYLFQKKIKISVKIGKICKKCLICDNFFGYFRDFFQKSIFQLKNANFTQISRNCIFFNF